MLRPSIPGFYFPLLYSEIFGLEASRTALNEQLRRVDWRGVVEASGGILSVAWRDGIEGPKHQRPLAQQFANLLMGPVLIRRLQMEPNRPVFTREGLLAVMRAAILLKNETNIVHSEFQDAFLRALLIANELLSQEITPATPDGTPKDLLASELRSQIQNIENLHELIGRTEAFLAWSQTETARSSSNYLDVEEDFSRFTGIPWISYAAATYAVLSRYVPAPSSATTIIFDIPSWMPATADTHTVSNWMQICAINIEDLRASWSANSSLAMAAVGQLLSRPVVHIGDGRYFVPHPALVQNLLGDGVYYALLSGYKADDSSGKKLKRFTRFYGEFYERYVADCLEAAYRGRTGDIVLRQAEYCKGSNRILSTDVIISEGEDVLFFEIMAKRPKLVESVVGLDESAIENDTSTFVNKLKELNNRISDFCNNLYFADVPRSSKMRVFPIIVTPTLWPRVHLLHNVVPEALAKNQWLVGCEPVELMDVRDIELLEVGLPAGVRLGALLDRKNRPFLHPDARFKSVSDYLYYYEPNLFERGELPARSRGGTAAKHILRVAEEWISGQRSI